MLIYRAELLNHMAKNHNFNIGHPDNLGLSTFQNCLNLYSYVQNLKSMDHSRSDIELIEHYESCLLLILVYTDELLTLLHQKVDG